jgi:hypothetical protein
MARIDIIFVFACFVFPVSWNILVDFYYLNATRQQRLLEQEGVVCDTHFFYRINV